VYDVKAQSLLFFDYSTIRAVCSL